MRAGRPPPLLARFVLAVALPCFLPEQAAAQPAPATSTAGHRSPLPKLPSIVLPPPAPGTTAELDQILARAASATDGEQTKARTRLREGAESLLPAMAKKLVELRKSANRDEIEKLIEEARKRGKKGKSRKEHDKASNRDEGDWLGFVQAAPRPTDAVYKDAVAVLVIERALLDLGSTPAVRELVNVFFYFGELFRIDVQHMVEKLGDRAVPALIEGRKHDVEKVRRWCAKELDTIGKAIPGEAVQVADAQTLADVLRAYGRTKEIDALRVVVSFTGNDRVQVRDAAREAVVSYGDAALWQLREQYESFTGNRPPAGAPWDRIAQDIFTAHDSARLAEVVGTFDEGKERQREGKLEEMADAFDKVLARVPTYERRGEMAPGYFALAQKVDRRDPARAVLLARKALRLAPESSQANALASYISTLEGEELAAHGVVDTARFKRALEKDPGNERAKAALVRLETQTAARPPSAYRYLGAAVIGLAATLASLFVGLFGRRRETETTAPGGVVAADDPAAPAPAEEPSASGEENLHRDDGDDDAQHQAPGGDSEDEP